MPPSHVRRETLQPKCSCEKGGERHFDQQPSVAPNWAYIWGNKAQSQPLIRWDLEHIPPEAFDLWSASVQLTPDLLLARSHAHQHIRTSASTAPLILSRRRISVFLLLMTQTRGSLSLLLKNFKHVVIQSTTSKRPLEPDNTNSRLHLSVKSKNMLCMMDIVNKQRGVISHSPIILLIFSNKMLQLVLYFFKPITALLLETWWLILWHTETWTSCSQCVMMKRHLTDTVMCHQITDSQYIDSCRIMLTLSWIAPWAGLWIMTLITVVLSGYYWLILSYRHEC